MSSFFACRVNRWFQEASTSFLKKRSKKLSLLRRKTILSLLQTEKVFLLLFVHKKKTFLATLLTHPFRASRCRRTVQRENFSPPAAFPLSPALIVR